MNAKDLIARINKVKSFDSLNGLTAGVRLGDYAGDERRAVEAAISARREYIAKLARTL